MNKIIIITIIILALPAAMAANVADRPFIPYTAFSFGLDDLDGIRENNDTLWEWERRQWIGYYVDTFKMVYKGENKFDVYYDDGVLALPSEEYYEFEVASYDLFGFRKRANLTTKWTLKQFFNETPVLFFNLWGATNSSHPDYYTDWFLVQEPDLLVTTGGKYYLESGFPVFMVGDIEEVGEVEEQTITTRSLAQIHHSNRRSPISGKAWADR